MAEAAHANTVSVRPSFALIGQIRGFEGNNDASLEALEQAFDLSDPGSQFRLYAGIMMGAVLSADRREAAIEKLILNLSATNPGVKFLLRMLFLPPDLLPISMKAVLTALPRPVARAWLRQIHYLSARLFRVAKHEANVMEPCLSLFIRKYGTAIIPDELQHLAHSNLDGRIKSI